MGELENMNRSTGIIVISLSAYSGAVYAASMSRTGPSWESIAVGAVSMLIALVAAYAKGVSNRVDKLEARQAELNTVLLKEYHPKSDVREMVDEVRESMKLFHVEMKASMNELKQRFDNFENIYGR